MRPRADFAVAAIWLQSLTPVALRGRSQQGRATLRVTITRLQGGL